jgi:anti-sigma B factor antagonist
VPLSLQHRTIGDVVVVSCAGRVVEGAEADALHRYLRDLLPLYHLFILDIREVAFIDSAGLGLLVRLLSRVRASAGDLKLCGAGPNIEQALIVTRLKSVLGTYATETDAIAAFYQTEPGDEPPLRGAVDIVCIHSSSDVLAYLRELLRRAGYAAMTTNNIADGLTLVRATEPRVVVIESALRDRMTGGLPDVFKQFTETVYVIDLPPGFATADAGPAGLRLLDELKQRTPLGSR